jgi:hypothetical protein
MDSKDKENEIKLITSMADLLKRKPKSVMLDIEYQGDVIALEVEILPNAEWMALDHEVPHAERVKVGMGRTGPQYDYSDPDYQQALRVRKSLIALKRMARCIMATIPGETNDEKAEWLSTNYPIGFLSAVSDRLIELHSEGTVTIRQGTFRRNGQATTESHGEPETDA